MSETKNEVLRVRGFIYKIFPVQEFKNDFTKRPFILETKETGKDGKVYKNLIEFVTIKSFTSLLNNIGIGSEVIVTFALEGREWTNAKGELIYITSLRCWDLKVIENTSQERAEVKMATVAGVGVDDDDSDLPF